MKFNEREACTIQTLDEHRKPIPGTEVAAFLYGPSIHLARAHDNRFKSFCDPPLEDLGKQIDVSDNYPYGIGQLAVRYLVSLVEEAADLASKNITK